MYKGLIMKKTILLAVIFIGVLFCTVSYSDIHYSTAVGRQVPALSLRNDSRTVTLDDLRGKYVLLNFWKSTDALSRRSANVYTAWRRSHPDRALEMVSVNFDSNPTLFREIARRDDLDLGAQFGVRGDTARAVSATFGLDKGYGTLLINPEGRIIAHNPTEAQLDALVK